MADGGTLRRVEVGQAGVVALAGDITDQDVDAVVNAANVHLEHGGGVAAAISRAGGPTIQAESDEFVARHGPLGDGEAALTSGGDMPCRWVVHVAGPVYDAAAGERNEARLRAAVSAALDAAAERGARSVAFPAISAGTYGYPRGEATAVIASEVAAWLGAHPGTIDEVRLVGFDEATAGDFADALGTL